MWVIRTLALIAALAAGCERQAPAPAAQIDTKSSEPKLAVESGPPPAEVAGPRHSKTLSRIAIVGASASDGFLAQMLVEGEGEASIADLTLSDALRAALADETSEVFHHASFMFYTDPQSFGPRLLAAALNREPTLIVGVDFLFWYAYGPTPARTVEEELEWRSLSLRRGLDLLAELPCPLVLGDFPDMSGAATWMLPPRLIPSEQALAALNAQVHEWIALQENVILFPLRDLLAQIKRGEPLRIGESAWDEEETRALLLVDGLHPSDQGLIAIALKLAEILIEADESCAAEHFLSDADDIHRLLSERFADRAELP